MDCAKAKKRIVKTRQHDPKFLLPRRFLLSPDQGASSGIVKHISTRVTSDHPSTPDDKLQAINVTARIKV